MAALLIDQGATIDIADKDGRTPLFIAASVSICLFALLNII